MTALRRRRGAGLLAALLALGSPALAEEAAHECAVPTELLDEVPKLPLLAERVRQKKPVVVVAIGGSSTAGAAAQSPSEAYPQRLEVELAARYPETPLRVLNKGVPRQSAQDMLERFPQDVFAEDPTLVIWETGTTEAVRGIDVDEFGQTIEAGIAALRQRNVDVMLVDMQYSRRTASVIGFERYLEAMRRVAELDDIYLFRRFEIMKAWSENGTFNFEDVQKGDRAALAAAVYDCLARRLADAIAQSVEQTPGVNP